MLERAGGLLAAVAAFLKVIEEVHLVVLGSAQHRRPDEYRRNVERTPRQPPHQKYAQDREQGRDHGHQARGWATEYDEECTEDDAGREREAFGESRQQS